MRVNRSDAGRATAVRVAHPATYPVPKSPTHAVVVLAGAVGSVVVAVVGALALSLSPALAVVVAVLVAVAGGLIARRTLNDLFAGLTLLLARPYNVGEQVRLYMPEVGEVAVAEVVHLGLISTTLGTSDGLLTVPNIRMLRAAPECRDRTA